MIEFFVEGEPIPQPRPRTFMQGGRPVTVSVPSGKRIAAWLDTLGKQAAPHRPSEPLTCRLEVGLAFRGGLTQQRTPRVKRGDLDNYAKAVLDALTRQGFWVDDRQLYGLTVAWGDGRAGYPSGVAVRIREMEALW